MPCEPGSTLSWNIDPVFLHLGSVEVRYYSVCFLLVCVIGYFPWQKRMLRGGHSAHVASRLVPFAVFGIIAGGRVVHCLLYAPDYYLANPLQILDVRRGGLASHGSAAGLFVMFVLYSAIYRVSLFEMCDRFAISAIFRLATCA